MITLEILLLLAVGLLVFFNISDYITHEKLSKKYIQHIEEQEDYIRKLEHDLRQFAEKF